jgi:hypothetical protein
MILIDLLDIWQAEGRLNVWGKMLLALNHILVESDEPVEVITLIFKFPLRVLLKQFAGLFLAPLLTKSIQALLLLFRLYLVFQLLLIALFHGSPLSLEMALNYLILIDPPFAEIMHVLRLLV